MILNGTKVEKKNHLEFHYDNRKWGNFTARIQARDTTILFIIQKSKWALVVRVKNPFLTKWYGALYTLESTTSLEINTVPGTERVPHTWIQLGKGKRKWIGDVYDKQRQKRPEF